MKIPLFPSMCVRRKRKRIVHNQNLVTRSVRPKLVLPVNRSPLTSDTPAIAPATNWYPKGKGAWVLLLDIVIRKRRGEDGVKESKEGGRSEEMRRRSERFGADDYERWRRLPTGPAKQPKTGQ